MIPQALLDVLLACLEPDPLKRPTAQDLLSMKLFEGLPPTCFSPPPSPPPFPSPLTSAAIATKTAGDDSFTDFPSDLATLAVSPKPSALWDLFRAVSPPAEGHPRHPPPKGSTSSLGFFWGHGGYAAGEYVEEEDSLEDILDLDGPVVTSATPSRRKEPARPASSPEASEAAAARGGGEGGGKGGQW